MRLLTSLETEPLQYVHHSLAGCYPLLSIFCPLSRVGANDHRYEYLKSSLGRTRDSKCRHVPLAAEKMNLFIGPSGLPVVPYLEFILN